MTFPNPAERADWYSTQYEKSVAADGHQPAYTALKFGSYLAACLCGCINNDPALLVHTTWFDALDDARTILAAAVHGPAAGMETTA